MDNKTRYIFGFSLPSEKVIDKVNYARDQGKYLLELLPFEDEEEIIYEVDDEDDEEIDEELIGGLFKIISQQEQ